MLLLLQNKNQYTPYRHREISNSPDPSTTCNNALRAFISIYSHLTHILSLFLSRSLPLFNNIRFTHNEDSSGSDDVYYSTCVTVRVYECVCVLLFFASQINSDVSKILARVFVYVRTCVCNLLNEMFSRTIMVCLMHVCMYVCLYVWMRVSYRRGREKRAAKSVLPLSLILPVPRFLFLCLSLMLFSFFLFLFSRLFSRSRLLCVRL